MTLKHLISLISFVILSACVSPPSTLTNGQAQQQKVVNLDDNRYLVTFTEIGEDNISATKQALIKAAKFTTAKDMQWFQVLKHDTDAERFAYFPDNEIIGEAVVDPCDDLNGCPSTLESEVGSFTITTTGKLKEITASLEIVLGRGQQPEGPAVFLADDLLESLSN